MKTYIMIYRLNGVISTYTQKTNGFLEIVKYFFDIPKDEYIIYEIQDDLTLRKVG